MGKKIEFRGYMWQQGVRNEMQKKQTLNSNNNNNNSSKKRNKNERKTRNERHETAVEPI